MPQREQDERRWAQWMGAALDGDQDAYRSLLKELAAAAEAYLRSRFGAFAGLDDCVQECLLAVHRARHTYDPTCPFRPWFFTLVKHKAIDAFRADSARRRSIVEGLEGVDAPDPGPDPGQVADASATTSSLLQKLSHDQRTALLLTKFVGLSVRETATKLGVSESVVKIRVHRARARLRSLLEVTDGAY